MRIAHVIGKMVGGGVEQTVINYYKYVDKNIIQYDFIIDEDSTFVPKEEIESLGGKIIFVPPYQNIFQYIKKLIKVFNDNDYKIVYSHLNTLSVFPLFAAWVAKVPIRIAHNHSTAGKGEFKKNFLKYTLKHFSRLFPTTLCACSKYAGEWLFGKKELPNIKIWKNALELNKFAYDEIKRKSMREKFNIEDKFVVGHIGRFIHQKNHFFLVDIFEQIVKKNNNSLLILVGSGELENDIKKYVTTKHLDSKVMFLGNRTDVNDLYQMMDCFLFPSFYEGLGMVAVEAQISGLNVFCSQYVPQEAKICNNLYYCSLNDSAEKWANIVLSQDYSERKDMSYKAKECGYDIKDSAAEMTDWYLKLYEGVKYGK